MTHSEKMSFAWRLIQDCGITEDRKKFDDGNSGLIFVEDIYSVRDAIVADLESKADHDDDVFGFLDRHNIAYA